MKQISLSKVAIATSTFAFATLLSFDWCEQRGVSLSVESAQARVGRPLTPVSVAGVARRQNRRAAYGYGAGVVGAGLGAAAIGTAAAVGAATSPWGWGGGPYYTGAGYTGAGYYGGSPYYRGAGWGGDPYAGGPYYGGGVWGARAAYVAPATAPAAPAWTLWRAYHDNGPWYGFSGWDDYKARGGIACDPGTVSRDDDGAIHVCQ